MSSGRVFLSFESNVLSSSRVKFRRSERLSSVFDKIIQYSNVPCKNKFFRAFASLRKNMALAAAKISYRGKHI